MSFQDHIRKEKYICYAAAIKEENYPDGGFKYANMAASHHEKDRMYTQEEFEKVCVEAHEKRKKRNNNHKEKKRKEREAAAEKQDAGKKPKK